MAKRKRRNNINGTGRNTGEPRHIRFYHFMLNSPAFESLSPVAVKVLIEIWKRHDGSNNGRIHFGVREAKAVGVAKSSCWRALRELEEKRFIHCTRSSSFDLKDRRAREWAITALKIGDEPPTKEFMTWHKNLNNSPARGTVQSHQRDHAQENYPKTPSTVPLEGPSAENSGLSRSHQGDTYILPYRGESSACSANAHRRDRLELGESMKVKIDEVGETANADE